MDSVTLKDFRCFRGEQTARIAPLTLLVGENSTGKTSFLAILRALWEVAVDEVIPDFRREPYDLGAFSEIVYNDSSRGEQPDSFGAEIQDLRPTAIDQAVSFNVSFEDHAGVVFPVSRYASVGETRFEITERPEQGTIFRFGIEDNLWKASSPPNWFNLRRTSHAPYNALLASVLRVAESKGRIDSVLYTGELCDALKADSGLSGRLRESLTLLENWRLDKLLVREGLAVSRPYAGAPVRQKPRRTYDPSRLISDPEGEYVPTYLANMSRRDPVTWKKLKESLEKFGSDSGLFDEISIESFGQTGDATPFQIQIRKFGGKLKGNRRNLIDVGYGVSQALPIITELLRPGAASMFLLQQPEVHLHPSAQAALGSLFCSIAGPERQLVVETHSDYIIDRVRMDVRDKKTDLRPEDVSILYFERGESDVKIHSIRLDADGNVLDAPDSYGQFFMEETRRSIGL